VIILAQELEIVDIHADQNAIMMNACHVMSLLKKSANVARRLSRMLNAPSLHLVDSHARPHLHAVMSVELCAMLANVTWKEERKDVDKNVVKREAVDISVNPPATQMKRIAPMLAAKL